MPTSSHEGIRMLVTWRNKKIGDFFLKNPLYRAPIEKNTYANIVTWRNQKNIGEWSFSQKSTLQSSHRKKNICQHRHMKESGCWSHEGTKKKLVSGFFAQKSFDNFVDEPFSGSVAGENDGRCSTTLPRWWPCRPGWGPPTRPHMVVGNCCLWVWNLRLRVKQLEWLDFTRSNGRWKMRSSGLL